MAHDGVLTTTRIVPFETLYDDHSLEGDEFAQTDLLLHKGLYWFAIREGEDFHLRRADVRNSGNYRLYAQDSYGFVYRPIHPDMTAEDIEGAVYAHDDGTHWLFAHCSPDEQIDFAVEVEDYIFGLFVKDILAAELKPQLNADLATRTAGRYAAKGIKRFAHAASKAGYNQVIKAVLGHYHKDRHHDHKREIALASISEVMTRWTENGKTDNALDLDRVRAATATENIVLHLKTTHTIEWRHARVKRLEAEKKAAEAAAAETETNQGG